MDTGDFDRSIAHGESALNYLKTYYTPAYPRNYELWYTYCVGFNKSLNEAINRLLKRNGRVSPAEALKLYDEFLSPTRLTDRVEEVGGMVSNEIDQITEMLTGALKTTGAYGNSLDGAREALGTAGDRQTIAAIARELALATKEMYENNQKLEARLLDSKAQISELKDSLEAIRYESLTDQLTGISNRKHFDQSLTRAIQEAEMSGRPMSLLLGDIDHFKSFNDLHGHQTGDQVLRLVGQTLKNNVKGRDLPARYGGEEFGVILPETPLQAAVQLAENIRKAIKAKELVKRSTGESLGRITMSFGAAVFRPGELSEDLIHRADQCLYAAKRAGRDRVLTETDDQTEALSEVA